MIVEIVILAMIAVFLGLRLYAVLGRRPEQNEEPLRSRADALDALRPVQPAVPVLGDFLGAGDTVLVKASRSARLERVVLSLRQRFEQPPSNCTAT